MVRTICPSPPMRTKALGAKPSASAASASPLVKGRLRLSIRPPPAAAPACRNLRRETSFVDGDKPGPEAREVRWSRVMSASLSARLRGLLDRFANADIGPTAADVAGHRVVDVGIRRMRVAREQRRSRHDLARLAVAALNDLPVEPGLLDLGDRRSRADGLDRRDLGGDDAVDRGDTGTGGDAVDMHSAGAAERHAAAELRAGHAEHVAQHPQERDVTVDIDRAIDAVDLNRGGHSYLRAIRVRLSPRPVSIRPPSRVRHDTSRLWCAA